MPFPSLSPKLRTPNPILIGARVCLPLTFCLQQGDAITFSWHFVGIGKEQCFHDGVEMSECASPMKVMAKDVSSADSTHTFKVKFTDVCGETKTADYKYTQKVRGLHRVSYEWGRTHIGVTPMVQMTGSNLQNVCSVCPCIMSASGLHSCSSCTQY